MLNFDVFLFPIPQNTQWRHRTGILTVPSSEIGTQLLYEYGDYGTFYGSVFIANRPIRFGASKRQPRPDILNTIRRTPYVDPRTKKMEEERISQLSSPIPISSVQFGWEGRDGIFSLEWSRIYEKGCMLQFDDRNRLLRLRGGRRGAAVEVIEMRYAQVKSLSTSRESGEYSVFLFLSCSASFYTEVTHKDDHQALTQDSGNQEVLHNRKPDLPGRHRRSYFDEEHASFAPHTSSAIRLVCASQTAQEMFRQACQIVGLHLDSYNYPILRRNLFSPNLLLAFEDLLSRLPWTVAFHLKEIHSKLYVDTREALSIGEPLIHLMRVRGRAFTAALMQYFANEVASYLPWGSSAGERVPTAHECFERLVEEFNQPEQPWWTNNPSVFDCLHVYVTPTSIIPTGKCFFKNVRTWTADSFLRPFSRQVKSRPPLVSQPNREFHSCNFQRRGLPVFKVRQGC
jgi:RNA-dependent RNA polymerase